MFLAIRKLSNSFAIQYIDEGYGIFCIFISASI